MGKYQLRHSSLMFIQQNPAEYFLWQRVAWESENMLKVLVSIFA